uniref:uncharacterized protein LOC109958505 n=1 Tax=Monopterus albus TaxID=43700 RepID=UPI0009B37BB7|nr:uncharacterized protein LOC109958505 [Monopterus albus]
MEKRKKGDTRKVSHGCLLLLALLLITALSSAQNTLTATSPVSTAPALNPAAVNYTTWPANVTVAVGQPAVFRCGVPSASPNLTFTFYRSQHIYNLTCPYGQVEAVPQALGSCDMKNGESLAVWTLWGTSLSDDGAQVVCQQRSGPDAPAAFLHVYSIGNVGTSYTTLIGCTIGGFFGTLLVFGVLFLMLWKSETFQRCYRGKEAEEDMNTMVTKE